MSYSFGIVALSKAAALAAVAVKLDEVVAQQPIHEHDRAAAEAQATAVVELVPEPAEGEEIVVGVCGYVQWQGTYPDNHKINAVNVNVTASLRARQTEG